jgi:hypothetical protein
MPGLATLEPIALTMTTGITVTTSNMPFSVWTISGAGAIPEHAIDGVRVGGLLASCLRSGLSPP